MAERYCVADENLPEWAKPKHKGTLPSEVYIYI